MSRLLVAKEMKKNVDIGGTIQRIHKSPREPIAMVRHALLWQIPDPGHELLSKGSKRSLSRHLENNALDYGQRVPSTGSEKVPRYVHLLSAIGFIDDDLLFLEQSRFIFAASGNQLPDVRDLTTEIPLTLQNSHYSVAESVPYLANVVNVACLHCKPATKLSLDLESFLQRGESIS